MPPNDANGLLSSTVRRAVGTQPTLHGVKAPFAAARAEHFRLCRCGNTGATSRWRAGTRPRSARATDALHDVTHAQFGLGHSIEHSNTGARLQ